MENKKPITTKVITSQQDLDSLVKGDRVKINSFLLDYLSVYEGVIKKKSSFLTYDNKYKNMHQILIHIDNLSFDGCGGIEIYSPGIKTEFNFVMDYDSQKYSERLKLLQEADLYHG